MSKYKQVYRDLKEKIDTRVYKRNTELPSENELVKEYGYSKDTIRKALSLLEINGYIQKIKGKNSLILGHGRIKNNYLGNIKTSSELNIDGKYEIKTSLESLYIIQGDKKIMDIFGSDEDNDFYRVSRSRLINGERLEYEVSYFTHSRREISFRYATEEEKQHMDLGEYNMVAVVESITYLSNGNILQYGILTYRPDKFTFVTMAKR